MASPHNWACAVVEIVLIVLMATIRELERGTWLDDSVPDDFRHDVGRLCRLMSDCVADLVVSLSMFERAYAQPFKRLDQYERQQDTERQRERESELEADQGTADLPENFHNHRMIADRARRDVLREKWAAQGGPWDYERRHVIIHARSFVTSLALLQRGLDAFCGYPFDDEVLERLQAARDAFAGAFPGLKGVRDSTVHAEERVRGEARRKKIDTQPLTSGPILAPGGGVMVLESLNGQRFGGTISDGTYAEVDVSDATTEIARVAVQEVFDALPWDLWGRTYEPSR